MFETHAPYEKAINEINYIIEYFDNWKMEIFS